MFKLFLREAGQSEQREHGASPCGENVRVNKNQDPQSNLSTKDQTPVGGGGWGGGTMGEQKRAFASDKNTESGLLAWVNIEGLH